MERGRREGLEILKSSVLIIIGLKNQAFYFLTSIESIQSEDVLISRASRKQKGISMVRG